jgi:chromosome segregation ATPase
MEPRREAVLRELGEAWDEVEEAEEDRRAALRALEEDCLALYAAKVAQVRHHAACLRAEVDAARAELDALHAAIDDPRNAVRNSGSRRSLREELRVITSELEDMRRRRDERRRELKEVKGLIDWLQQEMRPTERPRVDADDDDLTMKRLQDLRAHLRHLQSEKVRSDQSTTLAMCKTKAINLFFFFAGESNQEDGGARELPTRVILGSRHGPGRNHLQSARIRRHQRRRDGEAGVGGGEAEGDQAGQDAAAAGPGGDDAGAVEPDGHAGGGAEPVPGRGL